MTNRKCQRTTVAPTEQKHSTKLLRTLRNLFACISFALAASTTASAQQFTLKATATAGMVFNGADIARLSNNMLVTAVIDNTYSLEVIVWQYVPACNPRTRCLFPTNTIVRKGTQYSYGIANTLWGSQVHIAATGPNTFVTATVDLRSLTHLTSWGVDSAGNITLLSDAYSTTPGSYAINCSLAALDSNHVIVWEYDQDSLDYDSSLMSIWGLESNGTLFFQSSLTGGSVGPVATITKVNQGQVVTGSYWPDNPTKLELSSWEINATGNIVHQRDVFADVVNWLSVASIAPGTFMTANTTAANQLEPIFWTVDLFTGAFQRGYSATMFPGAITGIGALDGVPITVVGDAAFRMDSWGNGPPNLLDLGTLIQGYIGMPALVEASTGYLAVAFQNSVSDFELQIFNYQP